MGEPDSVWHRVLTKEAFVAAFADKVLLGEGLRFVVHADGRITGHAAGRAFSGDWIWSDGYFCRTASLMGQDLGLDCELIEQRGTQMRYTRDKGHGPAAIVSPE